MALLTFSTEELDSLLIRADVLYMSNQMLGLPYSELKALIYPHPPYKTFTIEKRSGALRIIHEPRLRLKELQERFLEYLYKHAGPAKPCVHGFTRNRSIVTNAKTHCSPKTQHLLNIDIEDFFPSITFYRVRGLLQKEPFGFSYPVATVLAHLCTYNGVLPQGAPTSPLLANLTCRSLDRDLMSLAKRHRATYSRYADDITFSFSVRRAESLPANICSFDSGILVLGEELKAIVSSHTFRINPTKSRLSSRLHRLEVTGVTINEFPNIKRVFIDRIRGALNAWEKYGYNSAQSTWEKRAVDSKSKAKEKQGWKRQTISGTVPELGAVLWGKLLYVRMIRGRYDSLYSRLAARFNSLCERDNLVGRTLPVETIVRTELDARKAVFVVEWRGDYKISGSNAKEAVFGQGTAFAYKDVGLITCDHVLGFSGEVQNKKIETDFQSVDVVGAVLEVTNPYTGDTWPAKVVHRDANYDVALIQFDLPKPPTHHYFSGMDHKIPLDAEGILIGFPNQTPGKPANFLREKVLNRYPRSGLDRFEITGAGSIRQGNSGGPFVDNQFRVAGIAQQGAKFDGSNDECLCVTNLDRLLSEWSKSSDSAANIGPDGVAVSAAM